MILENYSNADLVVDDGFGCSFWLVSGLVVPRHLRLVGDASASCVYGLLLFLYKFAVLRLVLYSLRLAGVGVVSMAFFDATPWWCHRIRCSESNAVQHWVKFKTIVNQLFTIDGVMTYCVKCEICYGPLSPGM